MLVRHLVTSRQVPEAAQAMTLRRSKRTAEYVPERAANASVPESAPPMPGRLMRMFVVRDFVTISVHVLLQAIQSWGEEFKVQLTGGGGGGEEEEEEEEGGGGYEEEEEEAQALLDFAEAIEHR